MSDGLVSILDGNTFVVSDARGDIEATAKDPTGLFSFDTRFLSRWVLTVDGQRLNALSTDDLDYFETRFFLVPGTGTVYVDSKLSVIRTRAVAVGFREELTILNHDAEPAELTVRIEATSDFADLFEVKDVLVKQGTYARRVENGGLLLTYTRGPFERATSISSTTPAKVDESGLTFEIRVEPHGSWSTELAVEPAMLVGGQARRLPRGPGDQSDAGPKPREELERWIQGAPRLECDWEPLTTAYRRSLVDLASLRFSPLTAGRRSLPAAGLPWFMTMFGRDSIFTSLQALPFAPALAATTLRELGMRQGTRVDDFRDEDPGRILHEMRYGELTAFEERPHSPYYGCADATALFVVLLDEYERWTGDRKLVRELEREARAALNWIDEYADLLGNGYVSYRRRNELTVPADATRSTARALGLDPLQAEIRQAMFLDTPDLALDTLGVVVRARRSQKKGDDSVVKLRPVVPAELPKSLRRSPSFSVEVDASPGGFVCSASMKGVPAVDVRETLTRGRPLRKLFSKEQRELFAAHAPEGLALDDLTVLGPIFVLKLKSSPPGFDRKLVAELWLYPDGSHILELSTKCPPPEAFDVAAETRVFLASKGIDLDAEQQTKTRAALEYFSSRIDTPAAS